MNEKELTRIHGKMKQAFDEETINGFGYATGFLDGNGSACDRIRTATRWFDRSPLRIVPFLSCYCHCMWAASALTCAQQERPGRTRRSRSAAPGRQRSRQYPGGSSDSDLIEYLTNTGAGAEHLK